MLPLPSFIHIWGGLGVSGFAFAGVIGLISGQWWIRRQLRGQSQKVQAVVDACWTPAVVGLLIGGRIANQFMTQDFVWYSPTTWLPVTGFSLSYAGALLGAVAAVWWTARRQGVSNPFTVLDLLTPGAALVIAVGWVGVPVVGRVTTLPWALPVAAGIGIQPVQLYGLVGFGALTALLAWEAPRTDYPGQNFATLVVLGSALHFLLGFAEQTPLAVSPWSLAQLADAALALGGLVLSAWLQATRRPAAVSDGGM